MSRESSLVLMIANLALLIMIAIHDFDHMRQAMAWGYKFTLPLLLVNIIVYVPGSAGLLLSSRRKYTGVVVTAIGGPLIAVSFLKIHLLGAWIPVWGPWNDSFFVLGADTTSWIILAVTGVVGVLVGMVAVYVLGREAGKPADDAARLGPSSAE